MRVDGFTLQEIGEKYGVTKERVRQILTGIATGKNRAIRKNYIYPAIEEWMILNGIIQEDIAKKAGCSQENISASLTGKNLPSYNVISAILEMSGMTFQGAFRRRETP